MAVAIAVDMDAGAMAAEKMAARKPNPATNGLGSYGIVLDKKNEGGACLMCVGIYTLFRPAGTTNTPTHPRNHSLNII